MKSKKLPKKLLAWYDSNRRRLPWRAEKGEVIDPYRVWLSEIMLQQTTVKAVIPYFEKFMRRWPDMSSLAKAGDDEIMAAWAGLGYYSRARKLIECARLVAKRGAFPESVDDLIKLPGVGPYTAAAIAAIAFDKRAAVVDGNVERVIARIDAIETPLPQAKKDIRAFVENFTPQKRPGDFAQAMMDLGATICTPRSPACGQCPWNKNCKAFALGGQERFPIRAKKKRRPIRFAAAYWITCNDQILLRRRQPSGLLGGMVEIPSEGWRKDFSSKKEKPLFALPFQHLPGLVTHTFTHFDAEVTVFAAKVYKNFKPLENFFWHPLSKLDDAGLPSVMRKIARAAISSLREGEADEAIQLL